MTPGTKRNTGESKANPRYPHTLCWCCEKASGGAGCPWAERFSPVEGWIAEPTSLRLHFGKELRLVPSYCVHDCPLFRRDSYESGHERRWGAKKTDVDDAFHVDELMASIIIQAVLDWKALNYGVADSVTYYKKSAIYRDELLRFFFSGYFENMVHHLTKLYEPWEIRAELKIREEDRPKKC